MATSQGIIEFLTKPPAPVEAYSVLSAGRITLTKTNKANPYKVSIVTKDTLRLERTVNKKTDLLVVALATILAVTYTDENELIIIVGG